ncbi:phage terminase large subunit family protein [Siccirubricoccus sp. KC 17139]|uniref:Phage terminase large subunit family protein n=1 Tax=Siccirubricoccus soli TaxID=2899147 RepID=A0ABT1D5R3_9PROT|nr:phage terminase large subunit family protein [Siccirubricoccus soli]MCP2683398.1 phage terminase large subunit family protein [Siccirubricoccus soli]
MPLKGIEGWNRSSPVTGPTYVDVNERGVKIRQGIALWTVAVSTYKLDLYRRLWKSRGEGAGYPPGWVHLPDWLDASLVKQLAAEQLVTHTTRNGSARNEWRKLRDNEALECAVYARAALAVLGADRYGERFWGIMASQIIVPSDQATAAPAFPQSLMRRQVVRPARMRRSSMMDRRCCGSPPPDGIPGVQFAGEVAIPRTQRGG